MSKANEKREASRELVEFRVDEVSLVDTPAIEEEFAIVKRKIPREDSADEEAVEKHIREAYEDDETVTIVFGKHAPEQAEGEMSPAEEAPEEATEKSAEEENPAPAHSKIVAERVEALRRHAMSVSKAGEMPFDELRETVRKMNSLMWKLGEDREILVALTKSKGGEESVVKAVDSIAENIQTLSRAMNVEEASAMDNNEGTSVEKKDEEQIEEATEVESSEVEKSAEEVTEEEVDKAEEESQEEGDGEGASDESEEGAEEESEESEEEAPEEEASEEEKSARPKDQRKRFTRARIGKLLTAFQSLAEVMKEVDADSVEELLNIATEKNEDGGDLVAKSLEEIGISTPAKADGENSELTDRLSNIEKSLSKLEAAGVPKSLGSDGSAIKKSEPSVWKGLLGLDS